MTSSDSCCFFMRVPSLKDGSSWHGLGLSFLQESTSYSSLRYWKPFPLKASSGAASEVCLGMQHLQSQNSIWYFTIFSFINSLFGPRVLPTSDSNIMGGGHGWRPSHIFRRRNRWHVNVRRRKISFYVLTQGKKTSSQSQNISMGPRTCGTSSFHMSFHLILGGGGKGIGGGEGREQKGRRRQN